VSLILTAKVGRCLVLLPYDGEHNDLYLSSIEPAVARHMIPVRLDRLPKSDLIYNGLANEVRSSSAMIVDITRRSENVMYEVGYAHGCGLTPLIYTRNRSRLDELPIYLQTLNVRLVSDATPVDVLIDEYLRSMKDARRFRQVAR